MKLAQASVQHGAAVAVVVCLVMLFGYLGASRMPLQLLPDISEPRITIFNNWRSAAPQELEEAIIQPQEEVLRSNTGLTEIVANTQRGQGSLTLTYRHGQDMDAAMLEVINRLNQAPPLPADASEPFIASSGGNSLPGAASILVYAKPDNPVTDMVVYQDLIEEVVEPRLSRVPGVAQINFQGRQPREVIVNVDPIRAAMQGVQTSDIAAALARARDVSGGFADVGRRRFTVRFLGEQDIHQLENLVIQWRNGQPLYLGDVADVSIEYRDSQTVTLRNGNPSHYLSIARRNDANTVEVLDGLNAAIDELNAGPLEAAGLSAELSFDASLHIRRAISLVANNLLLGILLASLVLLFFLRSARATLMITLTVPVSLMVAFIGLDVFNLTLNVISLAGLAFSVGLVMDAAIIVQENIFRLRQSGMNASQAVIEGCGQVWGALLSSTLTTVAIFLPILFMTAIEGQLFKDLAITMSIAVLASLATAFTVLPAMTERWALNDKTPDRFTNLWSRLADRIITLTDGPGRRFSLIAGLLGVALVSSWLLIPKVDFLPRAKVDGLYVSFDVPAGTNVETIEREFATEVVRRLTPYYEGSKTPEIGSYNFASFNGFATQVYVYPRYPEEVEELQAMLQGLFTDLPDVETFVQRGTMLRVNGGSGRSIDVDIQGSDLPTLMQAASVGREVIRGLWENTNVFASGGLELNEPELHVMPRDRRINAAGIDRAAVGQTIRTFTGGLFAGEYFDGNRRMDMIIKTDEWRTPEELLAMPVATPGAGVQKVGDLVDITVSAGPGALQRVDGRRTVTLSVTPPEHITLEEALDKLQAEATPVIKAALPEGATVQYRGNADRLEQALQQMGKNFLIALIILFLIMAALFKSLRDSLIVLLVMPIAMAGGLAALRTLNLVTFQSLDMLTMIGFIILLGLVVNNAILLVDQTRRGEAEGLDRKEAVRRALRYRTRPMLMSSLTSIFGMTPLMVTPGVGSEVYRGLATVIVGGMATSALFTFILLPGLLRVESRVNLRLVRPALTSTQEA